MHELQNHRLARAATIGVALSALILVGAGCAKSGGPSATNRETPPAVGDEELPGGMEDLEAGTPGEVVSCEKFFTETDAKALGYGSVAVSKCDGYWYMAQVDDQVAWIQVVKSGKGGYEGNLAGSTKVYTEEVIPGRRPKGTLTEENKYGERSFIGIPAEGDLATQVELVVLKGNVFLSIKVNEGAALRGPAMEALARKLAELLTPRLR